MSSELLADKGGRTTHGALLSRIQARDFHIGVIGLGYVGLPIALTFAEGGFAVTGFDIDLTKVEAIKRSHSYLEHIDSARVAASVSSGRLDASSDFDELTRCDAIIICVPTPLTLQREPDMQYVASTTEAVARTLRAGQLVVLESSTYPGTTDELMRPRLEAGGLVSGRDFYLAFSPEREDPGNLSHTMQSIPKVVGADVPAAAELAGALYGAVVARVVTVSDTRTAEAVKLLENIFRAVNVALVNELKVIFERMGVDIWEVIDAAKTKPFGFMPFFPGPGLGGHCIPIDPFYLTWKAREFGMTTRLIELAGEINTAMPHYVVERTEQALGDRFQKALNGSKVLLLGMSYKKNVGDTRESPGLRIASLLQSRGAVVAFHDPYVAAIPRTRGYRGLAGTQSVPLTASVVSEQDALIVVTDHDGVDYRLVLEHAALIVDSRNAIASRVEGGMAANVVRA